ncbi:nickel/cobalt transporter [Limnofasciculus baicalensis]|uniref:Nickel/cobalt efflux system n=1 Tax=Limnofasciculus baicalensis BBK-W-15 TaxID=2699891 RepID=A0AAE3GTN9_9CYAN|nr:sulfite exporter TauE/SafE family protein [Limnofasciculus baicalensis]MCP2728347.1 sulfite exporter TauE/SafE family protein [Limnofasciculus baicalensis BBK-W-15]
MNKKWSRYSRMSIFSFLGSLLLSLLITIPSHAHWADLSVAEIIVGEKDSKITLTFPTGLVAFADENKDKQLAADEFSQHQIELENFFRDRIRLTDDKKNPGSLTLTLSDTSALPSNLSTSVNTHSTILLDYTWSNPVKGLKIHYDLFLPGVQTARCLATILYSGQTQNHIFSPENRDLSLLPGVANWLAGSFLIGITGAFIWGGTHAMSPGHGKTIVGAYLVGSRATPQHAIFLGLTTTITHTIGVFALGLVTLFASQYILAEELYPWLSLLSGLMVVGIGLNLLINRLGNFQLFRKLPWVNQENHHHHHEDSHPHHHEDSHHHHHEDSHHHHHEDSHHHHHEDEHSHDTHSHLPPSADGITWRSLLALGISGGILPCPSALVLLLSAIALGHIGLGLVLVLSFSLGLAVVLTLIGLLLVYAKQLFQKFPTQLRFVKVLPAVSALCVSLLGLGITTQALMQIGLVN